MTEPTPGQGVRGSGSATPGAPGAPGAPSAAALRRRRILVLLGAVVAVAAVVLAVMLLNRPDPEPIVLDPLPGETVIGPTPTPAVPPIERDTSTALLAALPDAVLGWAVSDQAVVQELLDLGALEAYTLTYTAEADEVTLVVASWRSPEAAQGYVDSLGLEGVPSREEDVLVAGEPVGRMQAFTAGDVDRVVWTNGATSFAVLAPTGQGTVFYDAFGM